MSDPEQQPTTEPAANPSSSAATPDSGSAAWKNGPLLLLAVACAAGLFAFAYGSGRALLPQSPREEMLLSVADRGAAGSGHAEQITPAGPQSTPPADTEPATSDADAASAPATDTAPTEPAADADEQPTGDDRLREQIIGTWQQKFYGQRLLTVLPDGKATMVIRPDSVWAFAFGQQISLDMFWTIENGRIDYGYTSGTPSEKVALARKTWGDRWDEQILELTDSRLILLCSDGETRSEWDRASTDTTKPAVSKDRSPAESK